MNKKSKYPINDKDQRHGLWICYSPYGDFIYKGQYINHIAYGYWINNWNTNWNSNWNTNVTFLLK